MRQAKLLLQTPSTNTGNLGMHRHPRTLPEPCCSILKHHTVPTHHPPPPKQHRGCLTSLAVAPLSPRTSQLLLPEPGQPSALSTAGAGPAGKIQTPPPSLHL